MSTPTKASSIQEGQEFSLNDGGHLYLAIEDAELEAGYVHIETATGGFGLNSDLILWVAS